MTNQYKTSSQLKNAAKDRLTGKFGSAVGVTLLSNAIPFGVSLFIAVLSVMTNSAAYLMTGKESAAAALSAVFFVISLVASIVMGVLQLGLNLFFLNVSCGQPYSVGNLFYGFRTQSNKALAISAVLVLLNTLCLTPYQIFYQLYMNTRQLQWMTFMMIAMGIGLLIYVPLSLSLSQSFYLMLDFPEKSTADTLKLSIQVMKGHKCRLFYIQASFLPLMILCLFSFGIGYLWLMPYIHMTFTQFFLDLMNPVKKMD